MLQVVPIDSQTSPRVLQADPSTSLLEAIRARASRQESLPLTHRVKADPEPFEAIWQDRKNSDLRVNDRDYRVGDRFELVEHAWLEGIFRPTGREVHGTIIHLQTGYGMPDYMVSIAFLRLGRTWDMRNEAEVHASLLVRHEEAQRRMKERMDGSPSPMKAAS